MSNNIPKRKYDEGVPAGSPSQDRTDRYPHDQLLRAYGFRIFARPRDGEPIWERENRTYCQTAALAIAKREQDANLERMRDAAGIDPTF